MAERKPLVFLDSNLLGELPAGDTLPVTWASISGIPANITAWAAIAPSAKADTAALANYLPLAGGTMSGTINWPNGQTMLQTPGGTTVFTGVLGQGLQIKITNPGGIPLVTRRSDDSIGLLVDDTDITYTGVSLIGANWTTNLSNIPANITAWAAIAPSAKQNTLTNSTTNTISGTQVQRAALTGDVTASANSDATTIANNAVTNAKAADMAVNTIKGRATSGTGDPEDLTAAQVRTIINVANGATAGATWGTNLSNIPANITAWAATAPSDFVNTSSNQSVGGEKTFTGNVNITGSSIVLIGDANRHIYFRNTDNTANRGIIYSEGTTGSLVYRAYDIGGIIYSQIVLTPAGSATINGSEIWRASNFDPATKANDNEVVKTSGNQTGLSGNKVWTGAHQVGSLAVVGSNIAVATNGNGHLWFREADNTTVRGLVYSDGTTRRLVLRSYGVGGVGYTQLLGDVATGTWTIDNNTIWHAGNLADTGWTSLTLANGWSNTVGYATAACRKFGNKVTVRGVLQGGNTTQNTVLTTLPSGYRPAAQMAFFIGSIGTGAPTVVIVGTDGQVKGQDLPAGGGILFNLEFYTD